MAFRAPKMTPRWPQVAQDGPEDGPRWPKMATDAPKKCPSDHQNCRQGLARSAAGMSRRRRRSGRALAAPGPCPGKQYRGKACCYNGYKGGSPLPPDVLLRASFFGLWAPRCLHGLHDGSPGPTKLLMMPPRWPLGPPKLRLGPPRWFQDGLWWPTMAQDAPKKCPKTARDGP